MISLEDQLSKFKPCKNLDYMGRHFLTHVPSIGELAYLNIIFDAIDEEVQRETIDPLCFPAEIREFYRKYNGAFLFSGHLDIYGFFPKYYLLDRLNWRKTQPHNIMDVNEEFFDDLMSHRIVLFGSYMYDRSEVFIERETGQIYCSVGENITQIRAIWPSFETWVEEEIARLSDCFDENGNRLVEIEETLPGRR